MDPDRIAWIDATAGIAGDMLLAALIDAGADLAGVQGVLDAVIPDSVRLHSRIVDRCGQRALKVDVELLADDPPHRTWASIRALLDDARGGPVAERTLDLALETFSRLAEAEAAAHGIAVDDVHFHEVGALDSLADVIGTCEAWRQLGITRGVGSVIAVGSGRIRAAHGDIPVPVPAVARLAHGWPTVAGSLLPPRGHGHHHEHSHGHHHEHGHWHGPHDGHSGTTHPHDLPAHAVGGPHAAPESPVPAGVAPGIGELATPTGVALVRGLADAPGEQPALVTEATGIGAGTKDTPGRPNVVRVIIGAPWAASESLRRPADPADVHATPRSAVQLEANLDDLDPRLWPGVLDALLEAGALDAWLTPSVMKRGRPSHTLSALVREEHVAARAEQIMDLTGTLGVRMHPVERRVRTRAFEQIDVLGRPVRVKMARDEHGALRRAEPEFRDVQDLAQHLGISEREALDATRAEARRMLGDSD